MSVDATYKLGSQKRCHIKGDSPELTALAPPPSIPILTDRIPGSYAPRQHTTVSIASLCSAYLSGAGTPIRIQGTPNTAPHLPRWNSTQLLTGPSCWVRMKSFCAAPGYPHTVITEDNGEPSARMNPRMEYKPYWLLEDWMNLLLMFYPTQWVVSPTMVHKVVLSRIGPS